MVVPGLHLRRVLLDRCHILGAPGFVAGDRPHALQRPGPDELADDLSEEVVAHHPFGRPVALVGGVDHELHHRRRPGVVDDEVRVGGPHGQHVLRFVGRLDLLPHFPHRLDAGGIEDLADRGLGQLLLRRVEVEDPDGLGLDDVTDPFRSGVGLVDGGHVHREHPGVLPLARVVTPRPDPRDLVPGEVGVRFARTPRHAGREGEDLLLVDELAEAGPELR